MKKTCKNIFSWLAPLPPPTSGLEKGSKRWSRRWKTWMLLTGTEKEDVRVPDYHNLQRAGD